MKEPNGITACLPPPPNLTPHPNGASAVDGSGTGRMRPVDAAPWRSFEIVAACRSALGQIGGEQAASFGVTSAHRGEGRTTLALASALVQSQDYGRQTILLELDLERPVLAARLGIKAQPGLGELLRGESNVEDCIQFVDDRLGVVVAGDTGGPSLTVLASKVIGANLVASLQKRSEVVVADLPPLLGSDFGSRLTQALDRVALVVRSSVTPLPEVRRAVSKLPETPPLIVNDVGASKTPAWLSSLVGR